MNTQNALIDLYVAIKHYRSAIRHVNADMRSNKARSMHNLDHYKEIYFACIKRLKTRANKIIDNL